MKNLKILTAFSALLLVFNASCHKESRIQNQNSDINSLLLSVNSKEVAEKHNEFLIQINIGEEDQKSGILPKDAANFIKYFRDELKLPLKGLMCIPPANENPSPYFAFMHKIAKENNLNYISQGMSGDYLEAIQVGTNQLRIGTAIFGNRD